MANANRVIRQMEQHLSGTTVRLATDLVNNLREATPRATGLAASSWIPGLGDPVGSETPPDDPSSAASRQAAGLSAIQGFRFEDGAKISIHGSQPYTSNLNEGLSEQADPGFIEATARRTVEQAQ